MMIPDLQASFVCEDVRPEAAGSHTAVGILNGIGTQQLPVRVFKLCVWTRWCSGTGQFHQTTRLVCPDEETVLTKAETDFTLKNEDSHVTNVNIFAGIEFQQAGHYHIEILLDDTLKLRYPLPVFVAKQRPPQG